MKKVKIVIRGCVFKVDKDFALEMQAKEKKNISKEWNKNALIE